MGKLVFLFFSGKNLDLEDSAIDTHFEELLTIIGEARVHGSESELSVKHLATQFHSLRHLPFT